VQDTPPGLANIGVGYFTNRVVGKDVALICLVQKPTVEQGFKRRQGVTLIEVRHLTQLSKIKALSQNGTGRANQLRLWTELG
jgi:hypothetical protein